MKHKKSELEQEFRDLLTESSERLQEKLNEVQEKLNEAEELAMELGLPFTLRSSCGGDLFFNPDNVPKTHRKFYDDDDLDAYGIMKEFIPGVNVGWYSSQMGC